MVSAIPQLLGRLVDTPLRRGLWVIIRPIAFIRPDGTRLEMPPFFVTDYASSPRLTWWAIPMRDGQYDVAAAFHDYTVRYRKTLGLTLSECHDVFDEVMRVKGVPRFRRRLMVRIVRIFNRFCAGKGDGASPHKLRGVDVAKLTEIIKDNPWNPESLI